MSEELKNEETPAIVVDETPAAPVETPAVVEEAKDEKPVVQEAPEAPKAEDVITTPRYTAKPEDTVQALGSVAGGAIGATNTPRPAAKPAPKKAESAKKAETVAIYSSRNVTWNGVGKVYRGYNIVEKDAADKWLSRDHVRLATPEEVAKEFGK